MDIIVNKEAPLELIRIIDQLGKETDCVDRVIIDAFISELAEKKAIGAFEPNTRTIFIDLGNCLTDYRWMEYGMLFISNCWLNALVAAYHEFAHACQIAEAPELVPLKTGSLTHKLLEQEAMETAMEHAIDYFQAGGKVPPIKEMGWLGEQIAKTLNGIYSRIPMQVAEELEAHKSGAVAQMEAVVSAHPHFSERSKKILREEIDDGRIGTKMEGRRYLTMAEFMGISTGS
jgi:hypothetical protein